jgi:hypothetical protein
MKRGSSNRPRAGLRAILSVRRLDWLPGQFLTTDATRIMRATHSKVP